MSQVRLLTGRFLRVDGQVVEDFEALPTGPIASIPGITGTNGCVLLVGNFLPR